MRSTVGSRRRWALVVAAAAAIVGPAMVAPLAGAGPLGTYVVTTPLDVVDPADGLLSLREAVDLANADGVASIVKVPGGQPVVLSMCGPEENHNLRGDLDAFERGLTIVASGTGQPVITTNCPERLIQVIGGAPLRLVQVQLTGGNQTVPGWQPVAPPAPDGQLGGGAVQSLGLVSIQSSIVYGNRATSAVSDDGTTVGALGGAVLAGTVAISGSRFHDNHADRGGSVFVWDGGPNVIDHTSFSGSSAIFGGALVGGGLQVTDSSFSRNRSYSTANFYGAAGAVNGEGTIDRTTFSDNTSDGWAAHASFAGTIRRSTLRDGTAGLCGAVVTTQLALDEVSVVDNEAQAVGGVCALALGFFDLVFPATVQVDGSRFEGNRQTLDVSGFGVALNVVGHLRVTGSLVRGNDGGAGSGAIVQANGGGPGITEWDDSPLGDIGLLLDRSHVEGNTSQQQAVVTDGFDPNSFGTLLHATVRNTTIQGNAAPAQLGIGGQALLDHATVIGDAGGVAAVGLGPAAALTSRASVLLGAGSATCVGVAPTASHTLTDDAACVTPGSGNVASGAAYLGDGVPFTVLGSTAFPRRPLPSWADHEPIAACAGTTVDQRSTMRPLGAGCSPGAIEDVGCSFVPCDDERSVPPGGGDVSDAPGRDTTPAMVRPTTDAQTASLLPALLRAPLARGSALDPSWLLGLRATLGATAR